MDFQQRLQQAIQRGQQARTEQTREAREAALSAEELRNLHSAGRLNLSDQIEKGLRQLCDHFPGFRFETIVDDSGWGARITRDDLNLQRGSRNSLFSRFQILIRPFNESVRIIEAVGKGTIQNKETLNRSHFQFLAEFDEDRFREVIDMWVLEFAEQFASRN